MPVEPAATGDAGGLVTLSKLTIVPARTPVNPAKLELALPIKQELQPGLTLLGFETLPGPTVRAGEQVGASLLWQAGATPPATDWQMSLWAKAGEGEQVWPLSAPVGLAGASYPTSQWRPGDILRGQVLARIPPTLEPGLYKLRLQLESTNSPGEDPFILPIGDFQVEGWPRMFEPPHPQIELGANFADQATLVGLDAGTTQASPGDTLNVRLYWRAGAEFAESYTAFIHLIGPDGLLYGQVDQVPGAGAFPTTGWLPDEYITDEYAIPLAENAPSGAYQIEIGMYNASTGQRLSVTPPDCQATACAQSDDKVLLPGLTVK